MRVLVISDVHANLRALDAVLEAAGTVDAVWHLGDVVGYGPQPNEVVARLREAGAVGVRGNHDAAAVGGDEIDWFNPDARRAMEWTRTVLDEPTLSWLDALPPTRTEESFLLVHGSPRDPLWEYVLTAEIAKANLDRLDGGHALHGHTHVPIVWSAHGGRVTGHEPSDRATLALGTGPTLSNPGSVGQPRDGIPTASYLVLDPRTATATWGRAAYDIEAVQEQMRALDLPRRLVERLAFGA